MLSLGAGTVAEGIESPPPAPDGSGLVGALDALEALDAEGTLVAGDVDSAGATGLGDDAGTTPVLEVIADDCEPGGETPSLDVAVATLESEGGASLEQEDPTAARPKHEIKTRESGRVSASM